MEPMMKSSKKFNLLLLSTLLPLTLCLTSCTSTRAQNLPYEKNNSVFDNQEFVKLVDDSYKKVLDKGYYELRVPKAIHGINTANFPEGARIVSQKLLNAGYEAYYVGGAIRDFVMGKNSNDIDIATTAPNSVIKSMFEDMGVKFHDVGEMSFAYVKYKGEPVDIATFYNIPKELHGTKGIPDFNPEEIHTDSVLNDSFRRDFAFNAFYYDIATDEIIDYHGGFYCIKNRLIKPIGDPYVAMEMDNSRVIRGLRFKARYNFNFSPDFENYIRNDFDKSLKNFNTIDAATQLPIMFTRGNSQKNLKVLYEYDLLGSFFRPIKPLADKQSYKNYVSLFTELLDEKYNAEKKLLISPGKDLYIAGILWPAVEKQAEKVGISKAIDEVIALQSKYYYFSPKVKESVIALLELEYRLGKGSTSDSDLNNSHFEDALLILKARAGSDNKIEKILDTLINRTVMDKAA